MNDTGVPSDDPAVVAGSDDGPGQPSWWCWEFDVVVDDGELGVAVGVGRRRGRAEGWYRAVVAGAGRPTVTIVDPAVRWGPRGSLECRAPGLWADHHGASSGGHWTVAAEALGVALDDPFDIWGRAFGDPTPVGLDLEWDPVAAPVLFERGDGWRVDCVVLGEVLVADERHELDTVGTRSFRWGNDDDLVATALWSVGDGPPGVPLGDVVAWAPVFDAPADIGTPRRVAQAIVRPDGPGSAPVWLRWEG